MEPEEYEDEFFEELTDEEEAIANCGGHYYNGVFLCGHAGSEDCEFECPYNKLIGTRRGGKP